MELKTVECQNTVRTFLRTDFSRIGTVMAIMSKNTFIIILGSPSYLNLIYEIIEKGLQTCSRHAVLQIPSD